MVYFKGWKLQYSKTINFVQVQTDLIRGPPAHVLLFSYVTTRAGQHNIFLEEAIDTMSILITHNNPIQLLSYNVTEFLEDDCKAVG